MKEKDREKIALFRMSLIGDLVIPNLTPSQRAGLLREKASHIYSIPGTRRTRVAESTLRDWVRLFRDGGLAALYPPVRCDHGSSRRLPTELSDRILALREEDPSRSVRMILRMMEKADELRGCGRPPSSTVYRLLQAKGMSHRETAPIKKDRRAFVLQHRNQVWQSDVLHGPMVPGPGARKRKVYLISIIDDATRIIPHCEFTFSESLDDFLPVFRQAILKRGIPDRLYVDNGAAYISSHLSVICATLKVVLIHAKPYSPESKGKIERWNRTVRNQFLSQLDLSKIHSLDDLNARLFAWVESEYHREPHAGLSFDGFPKLSPIDRWMVDSQSIRNPPETLDQYFLLRFQRTVYKDRTIHLNTRLFEVPTQFIGQVVDVRCEATSNTNRRVFLFVNGQLHSELRPVDRVVNSVVPREYGQCQDPSAPAPVPRPATGLNFIELTLQKHTESLHQISASHPTNNGESNDK